VLLSSVELDRFLRLSRPPAPAGARRRADRGRIAGGARAERGMPASASFGWRCTIPLMNLEWKD
jgi:hypothetical protein